MIRGKTTIWGVNGQPGALLATRLKRRPGKLTEGLVRESALWRTPHGHAPTRKSENVSWPKRSSVLTKIQGRIKVRGDSKLIQLRAGAPVYSPSDSWAATPPAFSQLGSYMLLEPRVD